MCWLYYFDVCCVSLGLIAIAAVKDWFLYYWLFEGLLWLIIFFGDSLLEALLWLIPHTIGLIYWLVPFYIYEVITRCKVSFLNRARNGNSHWLETWEITECSCDWLVIYWMREWDLCRTCLVHIFL